jgi:hypothetical protein
MGIRRIYEAVSPYPHTEVGKLDYTQTADVMYQVSLNYAPRKLERFGHTDWRFETLTFGPVINPPTGHSVSATSPNTTGFVSTNYKYKVTSIKDSFPVQESRASTIISVNNDLTLQGNYNTITVPAPSGNIARHVIYKEQSGVYGYIGATDGTTFQDRQIQPLLSETPPAGEDPFVGDGNYPGAITLHQQRLTFGGTKNIINGIWMSRSADLENMDRSRPARADDSLSFALMAEKVNSITTLTSADNLLSLTSDSIFAIQGSENNGAITPSEINPKRVSGRGARKIKPLTIDVATFFITSRSTAMRALGFSFEIQGYKSDNVSIFSPHLFKLYAPLKMVYQEEPHSCIYVLREDGNVLAFTWEAEQQVWGWSLLETNGTVEDIETIPESGFDRLYALIRRTIDGVEHLFHERMALPHTDITQACHLDCSMTQAYDPPRSRITGVWHLVGATVSMIYDGFVAHDLGPVSALDGGVDVPEGIEASIITIGLRYSGRIETLPAALTQGLSSNHVNRQQIGDIVVRTIDTRGIEIGASGAPLEQVEPKDGQDVGELMDVSAVDYKATPPGDWKDTSTIVIEQNEPLPAHVVGIFAKLLGQSE